LRTRLDGRPQRDRSSRDLPLFEFMSGALNAKLPPGTYSASVRVSEKVTTLNGKNKVKTSTTDQVTTPLDVTWNHPFATGRGT
jgi:hypothetical protein